MASAGADNGRSEDAEIGLPAARHKDGAATLGCPGAITSVDLPELFVNGAEGLLEHRAVGRR
jgi:hypothetical protein